MNNIQFIELRDLTQPEAKRFGWDSAEFDIHRVNCYTKETKRVKNRFEKGIIKNTRIWSIFFAMYVKYIYQQSA